MEVKNNDWFATLMFNGDKTLSDFHQLGITPDNTTLKPMEEYKNVDAVKDAFKDKNGKFDENKFTTFYNNAKALYNVYSEDEFIDKSIQQYAVGKDDFFAPLDAPIRDTSTTFVLTNKPVDVDFGIPYITETNENSRGLSVREIAQTQKAVDSVTGEEFDWSPNEKGGLFKSFTRPTLVLAQWDEDGTHMENGIEVTHSKGELKLNANNKPYYETLNGREIYDKEVLHFVDTITVDGSAWNKIDFLDSDGKEKSIGGTLTKTALSIIPMFIPQLRSVCGGVAASAALAQVMPVILKSIGEIASGGKFESKKLNEIEAWTRSNLNWNTTSDESKESMFTFENVGNFVSSISNQLYQQKLVGSLPVLLNKGKDVKEAAELGRKLALGYMAVTSGQDTYGTFKSAGANDFVAGLATIGVMGGLYKLMSNDYFKDHFFNDTFLSESEVRLPALRFGKKIAQETADDIAKLSGKSVSQVEAANFTTKVKNAFTRLADEGLTKSDILNRSLNESIEEMMEEGVVDMAKGITHAFKGLGFNVTETKDTDLNFGFSAKDILSRYGMAAVGGFFGGGIFALQAKYDSWFQRKLTHGLINDIKDDDLKRLTYEIATGRGQQIRDFYKKWHKEGRLGNTNLTLDSERMSYVGEERNVYELAKGDSFTHNDFVYTTLLNTISTIEQMIEESGLTKWLDQSEIDKIVARGYEGNKIDVLKSHVLMEAGLHSRFVNDFIGTLSDLVRLKNDLAIAEGEIERHADTEAEHQQNAANIDNSKKVKALKAQIKEKQALFNDFLEGKKNQYYAGQSTFFLNDAVSKGFIDVKNIDDYSMMKYGKPVNDLPKWRRDNLDDEYREYVNSDGTEKIVKAYDLFLNLSKEWAPDLQKIVDKLSKSKNIQSKYFTLSSYTNTYLNWKNKKEELTQRNIQIENDENYATDQALQQEHNENLQKLSDLDQLISNFESNPDLLNLTEMTKEGLEATGTSHANILTYLNNADNLNSLLAAKNIIENLYSELSQKQGYLPNDDLLNLLYNKISTFLLKNVDFKQVSVNQGNYHLCELVNEYIEEYNKTAEKPKKKITLEEWINEGYYIGDYLGPELENEIEEVSNWINNRNRTLYTSPSEYLWTDSPYNNSAEIQLIMNEYREIIASISDPVNFQTKLNSIRNRLINKHKFDNKDIKYLEDQIFLGLNVEELINKFNGYKQNITYSGFTDLFKNIIFPIKNGNNVQYVNLLQIYEEEQKSLASLQSANEYVMNKTYAELFNNKQIYNLISAVVSILSASSDNTNMIINSFVGGDEINLPEFDKQFTDTLFNEANLFIAKLDGLKLLSDSNTKSSLVEQKQIEINMHTKFLKELTNSEFMKAFDEIFEPHGEPPLEDYWKSIIPTDFDIQNVNETTYKEYNKLFTQLETTIGNRIRNSKLNDDPKELALKLRGLVSSDNKSSLWKMISTRLSSDLNETVTQFDLLIYLATLYALPTDSYNKHLAECLQDPNFEIAPVYGQEMAVKTTIANLLNPVFFNNLLDEITDTTKMDLPSDISKVDKDYIENKLKLYNFTTVLGGAGTGKTQGVIKFMINYIDKVEGLEVVALAPTDMQSRKLKEAINSNKLTQAYDKADFFTKVFGKYPTEYKRNSNINTIIEFKEDITAEKNIFNTDSKVKMLIMDEITLFTRPELKAITEWARENGVVILSAGDTTQNSSKIIDPGGKQYIYSGLEDCFYLKSPILTASLRNANQAKRTNYLALRSALYPIEVEYAEHPEMAIENLNAITPSKIPLVYYQSEDGSVLYGEKIVSTEDKFISEIDTLNKLGKNICIIVDTNDKVTKYKTKFNGKNVKVVTTTGVQGGEYDYVFVDKSFSTDHKAITGGVDKFSLLRDLYTLSQRSSIATVFLDKQNDITRHIKITNNVSNNIYNQIFKKPDPQQIEQFKKWKLETLFTNSSNPDIIELFKNRNIENPIVPEKEGSAKEEKPLLIEGPKTTETTPEKAKGGETDPNKDGSDEEPPAIVVGPPVKPPSTPPSSNGDGAEINTKVTGNQKEETDNGESVDEKPKKENDGTIIPTSDPYLDKPEGDDPINVKLDTPPIINEAKPVSKLGDISGTITTQTLVNYLYQDRPQGGGPRFYKHFKTVLKSKFNYTWNNVDTLDPNLTEHDYLQFMYNCAKCVMYNENILQNINNQQLLKSVNLRANDIKYYYVKIDAAEKSVVKDWIIGEIKLSNNTYINIPIAQYNGDQSAKIPVGLHEVNVDFEWLMNDKRKYTDLSINEYFDKSNGGAISMTLDDAKGNWPILTFDKQIYIPKQTTNAWLHNQNRKENTFAQTQGGKTYMLFTDNVAVANGIFANPDNFITGKDIDTWKTPYSIIGIHAYWKTQDLFQKILDLKSLLFDPSGKAVPDNQLNKDQQKNAIVADEYQDYICNAILRAASDQDQSVYDSWTKATWFLKKMTKGSGNAPGELDPRRQGWVFTCMNKNQSSLYPVTRRIRLNDDGKTYTMWELEGNTWNVYSNNQNLNFTSYETLIDSMFPDCKNSIIPGMTRFTMQDYNNGHFYAQNNNKTLYTLVTEVLGLTDMPDADFLSKFESEIKRVETYTVESDRVTTKAHKLFKYGIMKPFSNAREVSNHKEWLVVDLDPNETYYVEIQDFNKWVKSDPKIPNSKHISLPKYDIKISFNGSNDSESLKTTLADLIKQHDLKFPGTVNSELQKCIDNNDIKGYVTIANNYLQSLASDYLVNGKYTFKANQFVEKDDGWHFEQTVIAPEAFMTNYLNMHFPGQQVEIKRPISESINSLNFGEFSVNSQDYYIRKRHNDPSAWTIQKTATMETFNEIYDALSDKQQLQDNFVNFVLGRKFDTMGSLMDGLLDDWNLYGAFNIYLNERLRNGEC